ncbi:histidine kinase [Desulfobulbus propionicus DSM 2032]|uniref:histidine kinase n=1 Tax=Desulfobulbus propionicus (strain ATCC 33891 / DSM 2032 / VKM B-1956 / 1pr3) TaxID=577650 RepID=A0A7U4DQ62_DESPD|nr:HAMP domain-containing sensor histidine kinase [Desulfobulbus propionicus]ADW18702.1 histidine kinase [Desulfobulbus propionicus DSM 2032]
MSREQHDDPLIDAVKFSLHMPLAAVPEDCGEAEPRSAAIVGLGVLDKGCFRAVDQGLAQLTGFPSEELLGRHWGLLFACANSPPPLPTLPGSQPLCARSGQWQRKDGALLSVVYSAVPLAAGAGRQPELVLVVHEAGESKESEHLADAVDDRGGPEPLMQEKLRTIGALTVSLVHELNNPLCGVRGVVERMARKTDPAAAERSLLDLALGQCTRMQHLLRAVQQFAVPGPEARRIFDLHQALDSVLLLLDKYLKFRKVRCGREYGAAPLPVAGVESQIKQMLLDLITTRGDSIGATGGEMRIRTGRAGHWIQVEVENRAEQGTSAAAPLHELPSSFMIGAAGLSLVRDILRKHQGLIQVEAVPGRGSIVTVSLPAANLDNAGSASWNRHPF